MNQQLGHNYFESQKGVWSQIPTPVLNDIDLKEFKKETFEKIRREMIENVFISFEVCNAINISV